MYRHVLIPVDCSPESRRAASELARFLVPLVPCRVTLIAATSPARSEDERRGKARHASEAVRAIRDIFAESGVYTTKRIAEGVEDGDLAAAANQEAQRTDAVYDLILLGTHQTRQEEFDLPCAGSLADRICANATVPVLILPTRRDVGRLALAQGAIR